MGLTTIVMVLFAGVVGPDSARVDRQLGQLLHKDAKVEAVDVSGSDQKVLGSHGDKTEKIVKKLHTNGVVAGEVVQGKKGRRLRVFVYDGDGNVVSQVEVPLEDGSITKSGVSMLREAVVADVLGLGDSEGGGGSEVADEPAPAPKSKKSKKVAKAAPAPAAEEPASEPAPAAEETASSGHDDDEVPAELSAKEDPGSGEAAAAATSSSAGELTQTAQGAGGLHMGVSVGAGFLSRSFKADATAISRYSAPAVGSLIVQGDIEPTRRLRLDLLGERSLNMISALPDDSSADSAVQRWQAEASFAVVTGKFSLAPALGIGARSFSIDSASPNRSPDSDYLYLLLGARAQLTLGTRAVLGLNLHFEPVVSGDQPTKMQYGDAVRTGYEVGVNVDVQLTSWLIARAEGGYQMINWTFSGAGGATDAYAGATASLGARF
jgi:hypothetical protein